VVQENTHKGGAEEEKLSALTEFISVKTEKEERDKEQKKANILV
jgi:hypothetical protein